LDQAPQGGALYFGLYWCHLKTNLSRDPMMGHPPPLGGKKTPTTTPSPTIPPPTTTTRHPNLPTQGFNSCALNSVPHGSSLFGGGPLFGGLLILGFTNRLDLAPMFGPCFEGHFGNLAIYKSLIPKSLFEKSSSTDFWRCQRETF